MKKMRLKIRSAIYPIILASLLSGCNQKTEIDVPTGQLSYATESQNIKSDDFGLCSALILDAGKRGCVMAHSIPSKSSLFGGLYLDTTGALGIYENNVVSESLKEIDKRGIPRSEVEAIVNAGETNGLEKIKKDLISNGINIRKAYLEEDDKHTRTVKYNPRLGRLNVKYN